jgi:hypothetical protein
MEGRSMMAAEIARVLGGRPAGNGYLCRCPVPTHGKGNGDRHPSLGIRDGAIGLLAVCFAGARDVLVELRRQGLIHGYHQSRTIGRLGRYGRKRTIAAAQEPDAKAIALWASARPATDTVVERYLRGRGIICSISASIRFAIIDGTPVMLAAVQRSDGNQIIAVQKTLLTWDGARRLLSAFLPTTIRPAAVPPRGQLPDIPPKVAEFSFDIRLSRTTITPTSPHR